MDHFHAIRLANTVVDQVRRRIQQATLGHRGRKRDPLYRIRKLVLSAQEQLTQRGRVRLRAGLRAGDPTGELAAAWQSKELLRDIYLSWLRVPSPEGGEEDYYLRQLRDWKLSAEIEQMTPQSLEGYARLCGWTRARARSGDRIAVSAYLGNSTTFDNAVATSAGQGQLLPGQHLPRRPSGVQHVALGAVASGRPLGPVHLDHQLAPVDEQAG
jgi:Uncharacterized protein conserved in bacteria (DUF2252)/Transposase